VPADAQAVSMSAIELFDADFGPRILPVIPPSATLSPSSKVYAKDRGKAPGRLTSSGWLEVSVNAEQHRCLNYKTAQSWETWGANVGFVVGDGYVVIDNDQGEEFSGAIVQAFEAFGVDLPRRYVLSPTHKRDAFFLRVVEKFICPADVRNSDFRFRKGVVEAKVQILARSKQSVISGMHPDTKCPYVWDRKIANIRDIPEVSPEVYDQGIRNFMEALAKAGWAVPQAPPAPTPGQNGNAAIATQNAPIAVQLDPAFVKERLDDLQALLRSFPNREVPPGEQPTAIDRHLDDYENWVKMFYRIIAHVGLAIALLPETEVIVLDWSDGRHQLKYSSRKVWRSALQNPTRYGELALLTLVRQFVPSDASYPDDNIQNDPTVARHAATAFPILNRLIADWAYFADGNGAFVNVGDGRCLTTKGFSELFTTEAREIVHQAGGPKAAVKALGLRKGRQPDAAHILLAQNTKRLIGGITYAPGSPALVPNPDSPVLPFANRWRAPVVGYGPPRDVGPWLDHVDLVVGPSEAARFIRWCAYLAQCPAEKPNWHYLVMSVPGLGKDVMVRPLMLAVGSKNYKSVEMNALFSDFNDVYEAKLLVISETIQATNKDNKVAGTRLKQLQARPPNQVRINLKHITPYWAENLVATLLFSNEANPIYVEENDRRLFVVNRRHIPRRPDPYYDGVQDWLDNQGGLEAVALYLHMLPLSEADKREFRGPAPPNPDKDFLIQQNKNPILASLEEIIEDGQVALTTISELAGIIEVRNKHQRFTPQQVTAFLLDMEHRGDKGVGRLRKDPRHRNSAGIVTDGKGAGQRLWHLTGKGPQGRAWDTFTGPELLALWKGQPLPKSATVIRFPEGTTDEPI